MADNVHEATQILVKWRDGDIDAKQVVAALHKLGARDLSVGNRRAQYPGAIHRRGLPFLFRVPEGPRITLYSSIGAAAYLPHAAADALGIPYGLWPQYKTSKQCPNHAKSQV